MGEASLTGRTLAGLNWAGLSAVGQALLTVSILAVLARLLTPEDFGLVAIAMIFVTAAHNLGHRNIGAAIVQRAELTERHIAAGVTLSIAAGAVFAGAVWALAAGRRAVLRRAGRGADLKSAVGRGRLNRVRDRAGVSVAPRPAVQALTAAELVAQAFGYGAVDRDGAVGLRGLGARRRHRHASRRLCRGGARRRAAPAPARLSRREAGELLGAVAGFSSVAAFNLIGNQGSRLSSRACSGRRRSATTRGPRRCPRSRPPRADRGQGALPRHGAAPAAHRPARRGVPARCRDPVVAGPSGDCCWRVRRGGRGGGAGRAVDGRGRGAPKSSPSGRRSESEGS